MRSQDFTSERSGKIIRTPQGYDAFVPHPLPPQIRIDWHLSRAIAESERALGNLSGVGSTLPNPHLLINPFMRKEAVLSSKIEGTLASLSDLFLFEASSGPERERDRTDVREVSNYVRAMESGLSMIKAEPVSLRMLRSLHDILMRGVRGGDVTPGEFRDTQNWIGAAGARLDEATYVPPPRQQMVDSLNSFEVFLHEPQTLPFLVWLAIAHYQFEAIHPFRDGNGRIGRLLLVLLMCAHEALCQPLLYLSAFFERHRSEYYERLLAVSQKGEWEGWVQFFLRAVEEQARDAILRATKLNALRVEYRDRATKSRSSALLLTTIDQLFQYPAITIPRLKEILGVTYPTAQQIVEKLSDLNVLDEATGRARNRVFYAAEVFAIVED